MGRSILTIWGQWATTGLVLLGLLVTPVTCTLVTHPHSLFDMPAVAADDDHAAHTGALGRSHVMPMINGAPPLAGDVPLPPLNLGTVGAWLSGGAFAAAAGTGVVGADRGAAALPTVTAAAMTMVASGTNALLVTLSFLLAVALVAIRPLPAVATLAGRALAIIAPPPKRSAVV